MMRALSIVIPLLAITAATGARAQDVLDDGSAPLSEDVGAYAPPAIDDLGVGGGTLPVSDAPYVGMHPLDGGGYCYERGVHVHAAPGVALGPYYRDCGGAYCFVGDPLPFGYLGNVTAYDGYHPLLLTLRSESYCYLHGFHYHVFAPSPGWAAWYAFFSGAWAYRGQVTVAFERDRAKYERDQATYTSLAAHQRSIQRSLAHYSDAARNRLKRSRGRTFAGNRHAAIAARARLRPAGARSARNGGGVRAVWVKRTGSTARASSASPRR